MKTDHCGKRGEEFSVRFSSLSEQCAEDDEHYPVGFFNYFFLCLRKLHHISLHSFCSVRGNKWLLEWHCLRQTLSVTLWQKRYPFVREMTSWLCLTPISVCILVSFWSVPVPLAQKFCLATGKDCRIWLLMEMIKISPFCLSEMSFLWFQENAPAQYRFHPHEYCSDRHNET